MSDDDYPNIDLSGGGEEPPKPPDKAEGRARGRVQRNISMAQVEEHNEPSMEMLVEAGWAVARRSPDLTGDDIRDELGVVHIREPRVMGPVMKQLERDGVIAPTNEYRQGHRGINHARPQRIWRSLICTPLLKAVE